MALFVSYRHVRQEVGLMFADYISRISRSAMNGLAKSSEISGLLLLSLYMKFVFFTQYLVRSMTYPEDLYVLSMIFNVSSFGTMGNNDITSKLKSWYPG